MTTGEQRYRAMFERLRGAGEGAFVPFAMLGCPDQAGSLELIRAMARSGADALELGIPFSDPVADGPVIQESARRALAAGVTPDDCWRLVAALRREFPSLPMGLLVYANLVVHRDPAGFYRDAAAAGVDSILVADAPLAEAAALARIAEQERVAPVLIAPPNADDGRLEEIAQSSRGYVYVVSRPGVTGADDRLSGESRRLLDRLRSLNAPPSLLGFGISTPAHVRQALALGAAGAISGSAIMRVVNDHQGTMEDLIAGVSGMTAGLKGGSRPEA